MRRTLLSGFAAVVPLAAYPAAGMAQAPTVAASIEVVGGKLAGKYTLASPDGGCLVSQNRKKGGKDVEVNLGLGPSAPNAKDPGSWTVLQLKARGVQGSTPVTADYVAQVTFGPVGDRQLETYYLSGVQPSTGRQGGNGTLTLKEDNGSRAVVALDLQPAPGVAIQGVVTCTKVVRY